jgi:hypothetical protein
MAVEMCAFKLNDRASKVELNAYALRRGFSSLGDMARFTFYTYLDKVHYPFKAENSAPNSTDGAECEK